MNRRTLLSLSLAAAGGIFAPRFGHWYRRGSGLVVPQTPDVWGAARFVVTEIDRAENSITIGLREEMPYGRLRDGRVTIGPTSAGDYPWLRVGDTTYLTFD